ncbi:MAG: pyridoxamine 5'-phosphate oxidase family protein [Gemmatimonadaceae bacterium]|nr:pyridoxamine 5'-phosphate oxidase family protein [Gemmatimonadaceae bacterium]
MLRVLSGIICSLVFVLPAMAQRSPSASTRAAMDDFVITVRDMAAWAVVTPAAHVPVGGMLDARGNVESVVGTTRESLYTPDTAVAAFRQLMGAAGRRQRSTAIGIAYIIRQSSRASAKAVEAIIVEAEHRTGYRTTVMYPFTRSEAGEPVFGRSVRSTGTLRELTGRRDVAEASPPASPRDTVGRPSLEESARRIVRAVPYPTFITTDANGRPMARTVQPQQPDEGWTVWFATNPRTRKVAEVQRDPRVVLHYFDAGTLSYVSLVGRARVVRDRATKAAHWDRSWDAFYPDRDSSVVLIAIEAEELEIVSSTLGIAGDAATWRPPTIRVSPRRTPRR